VRTLDLALALAIVASVTACKRGSKRAARLVGERVPAVVVAHEAAKGSAVSPDQIEREVVEEVISGVWFVTATVRGSNDPRPWRCFFDIAEAWCDKGEGAIFAKVVEHRRLGSNRGAVDDPAWVLLLRHGLDLRSIWPEKGFPLPNDEIRGRLRTPAVARPAEGGVTIEIDAVDAAARIVRVRAAVPNEGAPVITPVPL
jgi:hypothetical protein